MSDGRKIAALGIYSGPAVIVLLITKDPILAQLTGISALSLAYLPEIGE